MLLFEDTLICRAAVDHGGINTVPHQHNNCLHKANMNEKKKRGVKRNIASHPGVNASCHTCSTCNIPSAAAASPIFGAGSAFYCDRDLRLRCDQSSLSSSR